MSLSHLLLSSSSLSKVASDALQDLPFMASTFAISPQTTMLVARDSWAGQYIGLQAAGTLEQEGAPRSLAGLLGGATDGISQRIMAVAEGRPITMNEAVFGYFDQLGSVANALKPYIMAASEGKTHILGVPVAPIHWDAGPGRDR